MAARIYFGELECFQRTSEATKRNPHYTAKHSFHLDRYPDTAIREEIESFVRERGKRIKLTSIRGERAAFCLLGRMLCEEFPQIQSFLDVPEEQMLRKARTWLMKQGKRYTKMRHRQEMGKTYVCDVDLIRYIVKIYLYLRPRPEVFFYDDDRWHLAKIPIRLKKNPVKRIRSISFQGISQRALRNEVKSIIYLHLQWVSVGTVCGELTAVKRFSRFLADKYPSLTSLKEVTRQVIERYLVYLNTEDTERQYYDSDLSHLRSVFVTAGKIMENHDLETLFFEDDYGKRPIRVYKVYSDEEVKRLNAAIVECDEQFARAMILHQLLGTRISETLTLRQDAIREGENGTLFLQIRQVKTGRTYEKAINEDVKRLFDRACEYTNCRHGMMEYVFVSEVDPMMPMQYSTIQYRLMSMIREKDLRDDHGELFGVGTHIWRHCYGKRLTELHVDDVTIAKLLGHANTSSLRFYRRVGDQMMADETRTMRKAMDDTLTELIEAW